MAGTLEPGDFVLVNLFSHGLSKESRDFHSNDVVVFNLPFDYMTINDFEESTYPSANQISSTKPEMLFYTKRIIGLPGDSLSIVGTNIYRNGKLLPNPPKSKMFFLASIKNNTSLVTLRKFRHLFRRIKIKDTVDGRTRIRIEASYKDISVIKNLSFVENLRPLTLKDSMLTYLRPMLGLKWNFDYIPTFYIPRKGDSVFIDSSNIFLYNNLFLLDRFENEDHIQWNLELNKIYVFDKDYYFVKGDQHFSSIDSRYWGLLPENYIIGKVELILFSIFPYEIRKKKWRWERLFMDIY